MALIVPSTDAESIKMGDDRVTVISNFGKTEEEDKNHENSKILVNRMRGYMAVFKHTECSHININASKYIKYKCI